MWDRTAPRAKRHLRFTEARGHHAPTTHLIEIDHNWRFSSPLDRQVFHNPTHAVVSRPGQAGLEVWLYSSIESSQRTRTLTHPSHASFSCLLPSSTPSISRPLLHHLLSSTLQHSCSCSTPRHRSPPPVDLLIIIHPCRSRSPNQPPSTQVAPSSTKHHHQATPPSSRAAPIDPQQHQASPNQGNTKANAKAT